MTLLETAINAARKAGAVTLRYFETNIAREVKADKSFVTAADREAEAVILDEIKKDFPNHRILSEEGGGQENGSKYQWVIDPLDGTANLLNGIPLFAVSIAALKDGVPVAAVVYQPVGDSLYAAEKGKGALWTPSRGADSARRKERHVQVSDGSAEHAMIDFGPGKKEKERLNRLLSTTEQFVKSKRYLGCCSLGLAYVARGGTEGFVCLGLNKWDYAAGVLLVTEAGGTITGFDGRPWTFGSNDFFIASNGIVHDALLALVKKAG